MIVTFTGDICVTGVFTKAINTNTEIFSDKILQQLNKSNFVIGNLEGPATASKENIKKDTPLKSPIKTIPYLQERNITVFNLANNHILDYKEKGLRDTLSIIKQKKCLSFGAHISKEEKLKPVILKKDDISIALFGITRTNSCKTDNIQLFSSKDLATLKKQLRIYKTKVDFIIISFHGGEEYTNFPSPVKRNFLKKITKFKEIDCVIAHHSHTFQGYETHNNKPIFYSLGNFIFDIPNHKIHKNTNKSALLELIFSKNNFVFNFIPIATKTNKIVTYPMSVFDKELAVLKNFHNYKSKWQKEASNILFRKVNQKTKKNTPQTLQEKTFLNVLFSKKFYTKTFKILKDKYLFSLYYNAIIYKIKNAFFSKQ